MLGVLATKNPTNINHTAAEREASFASYSAMTHVVKGTNSLTPIH
jgi:hypothetical protein